MRQCMLNQNLPSPRKMAAFMDARSGEADLLEIAF